MDSGQASDNNNNNNNDGDGGVSQSMYFMIVWGLASIILICFPFFTSRYRRILWWTRLRQCRWNVEIDVEENDELFQVALQRYNESRERMAQLEANSRPKLLSEAEEEEVRQLFLLERMSGFTTILTKNDIIEKDNKENSGAEAQSMDPLQATVSSPTKRNSNDNPMTAAAKDKSLSPKVALEIQMGDGNVTEQDISAREPGKTEICNGKEEENDLENNEYDNNTEECGDGDGDDIDQLDLTESFPSMEADTDTMARVPVAGKPMTGETEMDVAMRWVPNVCIICLSAFEVGDRITRSSNAQCAHVFHHDCLLNWMLALGRKKSRYRRRNPEEVETRSEMVDPVQIANDYPMLCPCCRQPFISPQSQDENDPRIDANNNE